MSMYSQDELDSIYGDLYEDRDFHYSSESEWDRAEASERGSHCPDVAWVASDRDVWYPNPYYKGPEEPHPDESGEWSDEELAAWRKARAERQNSPQQHCYEDEDIPF